MARTKDAYVSELIHPATLDEAATPEIEVALVEAPDPVGACGVKGAAEAPIIPVAGAIANAVADAIGKPVNSIPLTPFVVLEAIHS